MQPLKRLVRRYHPVIPDGPARKAVVQVYLSLFQLLLRLRRGRHLIVRAAGIYKNLRLHEIKRW